ncbi:MAG: hypothetical protein R2798_01760 [Chitinophagales bacterium]|nr:hypothetical protein [Bacteroidota bacterium]MCB9042838.1 hypothetical protein [Chitinophagales bacterium]
MKNRYQPKNYYWWIAICWSIFASYQAFAQEESEFAPVGAKWWYACTSALGPPTYWTRTIECTKDTLINNTMCKVLKIKQFTQYETNVYITAQNGLVRIFDGENFFTLYDFNAQAGDEWETKSLVNLNFQSNLMSNFVLPTTVHVDSVKNEWVGNLPSKTLFTHISFPDTIVAQYGIANFPFYNQFAINTKLGAAPFMLFHSIELDDNGEGQLHCYQDNELVITLAIDPYYNNGSTDCDYDLVYGLADEIATKLHFNILPQSIELTLDPTMEHRNLNLFIANLKGQIQAEIPISKQVTTINTNMWTAGVYIAGIKNTQTNELIYQQKLYKL